MRTHVSYNGYLQRVEQVLGLYQSRGMGLVFVSYGRLVNPNGSYLDAPWVGLYQLPNNGKFVAAS